MKNIALNNICLLIIIISFCSCGKELSRDQSISLINAYQGFLQLGNSPHANSNAQYNGYEQGFWDNSGNLTSYGVKFFSNGLYNGRIYLKQPVTPKVKVVTGITNAISPLGGEQKGMKEVQFQWEYSGVEGVCKRFIGRGGTGVAYLRLFDDGWRVDKTEIQESLEGFPLTSSEQAQIEKDRQTENNRRIEEANRIAEENRKIREVEEKRALLIERSKTPTKTIGEFLDVDGGSDGNPRSRKTILTDVNINMSEGITLWFGDIKGTLKNGIFTQTAFGWKGWYVNFNEAFWVVFRNESEYERFYQALVKSMTDWKVKYPELANF